MRYLNCEVTLEGMSAWDWIKEVVMNRRGLKAHGKKTRRLLREWLSHETDKLLLRQINVVSVDFATEGICKKVVELNFLNLL